MSKLSYATRPTQTRRHCTLIRIIWPLHNYGWGVCTQELKFARWNLHPSAEIKANEPRSINPNIQKKLETVLMCHKSKCYGFSYTTWYIQHLNCSVGNSIVHSKERKPRKYFYQKNIIITKSHLRRLSMRRRHRAWLPLPGRDSRCRSARWRGPWCGSPARTSPRGSARIWGRIIF